MTLSSRSSRPSRTPAKLSASVHRRLDMYALAASAAGVGILALAQPAEAKIVYTPAHVKIVLGDRDVPLDLNHDGMKDFGFSNSVSSGGTFASFLAVGGVKGNAMVGVQSHRTRLPAALKSGRRIGPHSPFLTNNATRMAEYCFGGSSTTCHSFFGPWANGGKGVKNRYLGLKFMIKGRVHYGWARLTVTIGPPRQGAIVGHLTGYALRDHSE